MFFWFIAIFTLISFVRTISFAVWNIKDKNISGGISLILLAVFSAFFSVLHLLP